MSFYSDVLTKSCVTKGEMIGMMGPKRPKAYSFNSMKKNGYAFLFKCIPIDESDYETLISTIEGSPAPETPLCTPYEFEECWTGFDTHINQTFLPSSGPQRFLTKDITYIEYVKYWASLKENVNLVLEHCGFLKVTMQIVSFVWISRY